MLSFSNLKDRYVTHLNSATSALPRALRATVALSIAGSTLLSSLAAFCSKVISPKIRMSQYSCMFNVFIF